MTGIDAAAQAALDAFEPFVGRVAEPYRRTEDALSVLQVNISRRCNLACRHCHVEAGPNRTEVMSRETLAHCLAVYRDRAFDTLDITGGAPETNPDFAWFIREAAEAGGTTMVRSNLVILQEPGYEHLPELYAELGVTIVASLPHYTAKPMEKQRGSGTFDAVIAMLQRLNRLGYGTVGGPELDLVYNPGGAFLPPDQGALEKEYKQKLEADFGIGFTNLFAIANNPLGRFGNRLEQTGNLKSYMGKLIAAFNPETVPAMMCRSQLSVGYDGTLYDCDFNQAADIPCASGLTIADYALDASLPLARDIRFGNHCYACCAGAGSS